MNALDALRYAAKQYPGGIAALATRIDKSPHTLRHELAGAEGHKLGLMDAIFLAEMCETTRLADAVAAEAGGMFVPLACGANGEPLQDMADAMRELAELSGALATGYADGKISANELREIDAQVADVMAVLHRISQAAKAAHEKYAAIPLQRRA